MAGKTGRTASDAPGSNGDGRVNAATGADAAGPARSAGRDHPHGPGRGAGEAGVPSSGPTPAALPLGGGGTTFIEASAGTGKTHALTTLVARLVVEEGRRLEQILVVTFTRAATAELRDRIRRTLGAALAAVKERPAGMAPRMRETEPATLPGEPAASATCPVRETASRRPAQARDGAPALPAPGADPQALELLARWERAGGTGLAEAARRLEAAIHDVDRAGVYTIHGFCQRVLADLAFECGFPFGFEVSGGDDRTVAGAVRDFWRRRLYPAPVLLVRHAVKSGFLPGEIAGWVSTRRSKTRVAVVGGEPPSGTLEERQAQWRRVFDVARAAWVRHRDAFRAELLEGDWLNRGRYRRPKIESDLQQLEATFAAPEPRLPEEGAAGRCGRGRLSKVCRKGRVVPETPLFDALDRLEEASQELRTVFDRWLRWARREALAEVRETIRRRVREDRRLGYDDLLIELDRALDGTGGARLAARIRREFPCALIDEYQDTDPLQARIFERIYGDEVRDEAPVETSGGGAEGGSARAGLDGEARGGVREEAFGDGTGPDSNEAGPDGWVPSGVSGETSSGRAEVDFAGAGPDGRPDGGEGAGSASTGPGVEVPNGVPGETPSGETGTDSTNAGSAPRPTLIAVGDPKQSIYRFRGADVFAYLAARRTARERLHLGSNWRSVPALVEAVNAVFAGAVPFVAPEIEYRPVAAARSGGNPLRIASVEDGTPLRFRLLPRLEDGRRRTKESAGPVAAETAADGILRLLELGARGEATIEGVPLIGADVAVLVRTREQGRLVAEALRERGVRSVEIDDGSVFDTREAEQVERLLWALTEPGREAGVRGALAGDLFGLDARALLALDDDEGASMRWAERLAEWRSDWESRGIGAVLLRLLEGGGGAEHLLGHRDGARRLTNVRHLAELLQEAETQERFSPAELAAWLSHRRREPDRPTESALLRLESDEQLVRILTVHGAKGLEFPVVFCPFAWDARGPKHRRTGTVDAMYHLGAAQDYREVLDLDPDERARSVEWLEDFSESVRLLYVALTRAKYRCVVTWGQVNGAEHAPLTWLLHRSGGGPATMAGPDGGAQDGSGMEEADTVAAVLESGTGAERPGAAAAPESGSGAREEPEAAGAMPGGGSGMRGSGGTFAAPENGSGSEGQGTTIAPPGGGSGMRGPGGTSAASENGSGSEGQGTTIAPPESAPDERGPDAAIAALEAVADRFTGLSASDWVGEMEGYAQRFPDAISVIVLDSEPPPVRALALPEGPLPALAARELGRPLRRIRQLTSFTALSAEALSAGGGPGRPPVAGDRAEVGRPDHDQHEAPADDPGEETSTAGGAGRERTAFTFPRGPVAGSCLHRIFERLDEQPPGAGSETPDLDAICRETLEDFGIGKEWCPAARAMVERTRAIRLHEPGWEGANGDGGLSRNDGPNKGIGSDPEIGSHGMDGSGRAGGFRLGDPIRRLVELEFHFPVEGLDRDRLAARLVEHGYPDPFARPVRDGAGDPPPPIHGFLRGYVDLVVEHAGRWYVLDYKSNWLGPGPADYAPEALDEAIRAGGYPLQYLIYLVALHRYLATRLPGYDYERHVGGAFYLFMRGIDPAAGMRRGVYFDRPSATCLHAIDDCFRGT